MAFNNNFLTVENSTTSLTPVTLFQAMQAAGLQFQQTGNLSYNSEGENGNSSQRTSAISCDDEQQSSMAEPESPRDVAQSSATENVLLQTLVAEIQAYPCIWIKSSSQYKLGHKKKLAWLEISKRLGIEVEDLKRKWKNLYDNYKKCLDRERELTTKSGSAYIKAPTCRLYNELSFLRDIVSSRVTSSNVALPDSNVKTIKPASPLSYPRGVSMSQGLEDSQEVVDSPDTPNLKKGTKRKTNEPLASPVEKCYIDAINNSKTDADADTHFCLSLVEILKSLPAKKKLLAKNKINSALIEFGED